MIYNTNRFNQKKLKRKRCLRKALRRLVDGGRYSEQLVDHVGRRQAAVLLCVYVCVYIYIYIYIYIYMHRYT